MLARLALGNVRKSLADFSVYFLTVMLGVAVFYAFNSMTAQQGVLAFSEPQSKMFDLLGMVIGGVSVFIAFVLVFLVVYANSFLIKRRKREFGVYLALGMSTGDVVKITAMNDKLPDFAKRVVDVRGIDMSEFSDEQLAQFVEREKYLQEREQRLGVTDETLAELTEWLRGLEF